MVDEDHNAKWEREARELAESLVARVEDEIYHRLSERMGSAPSTLTALAQSVVKTVLVGLLPRFRQEAEISSLVDEMAYRASMDNLRLFEVMAGVEVGEENE